jgi:hypothetical protein
MMRGDGGFCLVEEHEGRAVRVQNNWVTYRDVISKWDFDRLFVHPLCILMQDASWPCLVD